VSHNTSEPQTTGHEYDGIQEYDNPVPGWWNAVWYASFVFALVYLPMSLMSPFFVHQKDRLAAAQAHEFEVLFAEIGDLNNDVPTLVGLMNDEGWMSFAQAVFRGNCVSCHGANAGGLIGPNLCDDDWKNVKTITDIHDVIQNGAGSEAMQAWGTRLYPNEIVLLSAYVASLRGSDPPNPRAPEGEPVPPWPTAADVDPAL